MEQIRVARIFHRVDVDKFMDEITAKQFAEQVAYDHVVAQMQAEQMRGIR